MTDDDLSDLKAALDAAAPRPDPEVKAAHLRLAQENFDALQGSRPAARPNSDRPVTGFLRGVRKMLAPLTTRGGLTATTALAAVALVALVPVLRDNMPGPVTPLRLERDGAAAPDAGRSLRQRMAVDDADMEVAEESASDAPDAAPAPEPAPMAEPAMEAPQPQVAGKIAGEASRGLTSSLSRTPSADGYAAPPAVPSYDLVPVPEADTEAYPQADSNPVKATATDPVSTFSIDVDTASWPVIRSSLTRGELPPEGAVRIEEMVNYFPYQYPAPEAGEAFRPTVTVTGTPWNPDTRIVHIGIQGAQPALAERPPLNLVFLIDTSGSMNQPDKLPLLQQSFRLMLSQLRPEDEVAIVTYAGSAGEVLAPTKASDRAAILAALDRLAAGGSTAGQAGLQQAYAVARGMAAEGEVSRVLLATDGDFNVGLSDPEALKDYIAGKRESGTYLSVLGFGRGNLDDATMQALAQNGNGTAAYIDTLNEAQKVLVDQLTGALFPIADDVKIQVEFNPARIAEYRLIGYETRALAREDFNNDRVDAGDIGAGHSVTALYEVTPVGSPAVLMDPLRYGDAAASVRGDGDGDGELGWFKLRYKAPGATESRLIEQPIVEGGTVTDDMRFALAVAAFGQFLRRDPFLGVWTWEDMISFAGDAKGDDPFGYRAEAVRLMRLAETLSEQ